MKIKKLCLVLSCLAAVLLCWSIATPRPPRAPQSENEPSAASPASRIRAQPIASNFDVDSVVEDTLDSREIAVEDAPKRLFLTSQEAELEVNGRIIDDTESADVASISAERILTAEEVEIEVNGKSLAAGAGQLDEAGGSGEERALAPDEAEIEVNGKTWAANETEQQNDSGGSGLERTLNLEEAEAEVNGRRPNL